MCELLNVTERFGIFWGWNRVSERIAKPKVKFTCLLPELGPNRIDMNLGLESGKLLLELGFSAPFLGFESPCHY